MPITLRNTLPLPIDNTFFTFDTQCKATLLILQCQHNDPRMTRLIGSVCVFMEKLQGVGLKIRTGVE